VQTNKQIFVVCFVRSSAISFSQLFLKCIYLWLKAPLWSPGSGCSVVLAGAEVLLGCKLHPYGQGWPPEEEKAGSQSTPLRCWHAGGATRGDRCFLCVLVMGSICITDCKKNGLEEKVLPLSMVKRFCQYPSFPPDWKGGYFSGRLGKKVMQGSVPGGTVGINIGGGGKAGVQQGLRH